MLTGVRVAGPAESGERVIRATDTYTGGGRLRVDTA